MAFRVHYHHTDSHTLHAISIFASGKDGLHAKLDPF